MCHYTQPNFFLAPPSVSTDLVTSQESRSRGPMYVWDGQDVTLECATYGYDGGHGGGHVTWSKFGGDLPRGRHSLTEFGELIDG